MKKYIITTFLIGSIGVFMALSGCKSEVQYTQESPLIECVTLNIDVKNRIKTERCGSTIYTYIYKFTYIEATEVE